MPLWGVLMLIGIPVVFGAAGWTLYQRRASRDPSAFVISKHRDGPGSATVVRSVDSQVAVRIILALATATVLAAATDAWSASVGGAVVLVAFAAYCGFGFWLYQSGRVGDGSVWLTDEGIHQSSEGVERGVRWDDLEGMQFTPTGLLLESPKPPIVRRRAPRIWVGKGPRGAEGALTLQLGEIHPSLMRPLAEAIELWATHEAERHEIGTAEAIRRLLGASPSDGF